MKSKLLVAILLSSATAVANPHDELAAARARVHTATVAVSYNEKTLMIAERDIATARIQQDTATKGRSAALRDHDNAAASAWAERNAVAVKDEREAQERADRCRSDRDYARAELQASTERVRELERVARRASR